MIKIIKDVELYTPEYKGIKTVVVAGNKIEGIYENITIPKDFINVEVIDGKDKKMFPGFIDSHVHILGGGGESGFTSRTPEINFSDLTLSGITTVVGCLGTDSICRDGKALIAKAKALEVEGITSFLYTGSYNVPVHTVTGSIKEDLMLIDKYIGVGEIAISDHRSSQPTYEEFIKVIADARVGGLLSGKSGVVNVHIGNGIRRLDLIKKVVNESEIPITQFLPTHINRNRGLFDEGLSFLNAGGYIDLTTSSDPNYLEEGEVLASSGLGIAFEKGVNMSRITFSSDGNGSMPTFDEKGKLIGLGICSVDSLYREVKEAIFKHGVPIELALKVITSNVADVLRLRNKGRLEEGKDSDFLLVNSENLEIIDVYAKGEAMVKNGKAIKKGTFEKKS